MSTTIYDNNPSRSRRGPWSDAFISDFIIPAIAPAFIIFGVFLCGNAYLEYRQIENSRNWFVVPGQLISVIAPQFRKGPFEPDVIFFKDANLDYSYKVRGKTYFGRQKLTPAGPRFYSSNDSFTQSGDSASQNNFNSQLTARYPQLNAAKPTRTAGQIAEPFKLSSLDSSGHISVKVDPNTPQISCLSDVLREHAIRIAQWGLSSLAIGLIIFTCRWLTSKTEEVVESEDDVVDRVYDQLFH